MNLREDGLYCDCTLGGGGHLLMMLQKTTKARFIAIDCDPEALDYTSRQLSSYKERVILIQANFAKLDSILNKLGITNLDGVLFDLGVSLHQLSSPERGFSFNSNGELLMQMSPEVLPLYEKLKYSNIDEIYTVLRAYGDVPRARSIARLIFKNRTTIRTTFDLKRIVEKVYHGRFLKKNLQRVFQAFRIWVNDELNNLQQGLNKAIIHLVPFGRVVVISYHSGEDRIVKNTFRELERQGMIKRLNKKVIKPSPSEIAFNPRSRSARMRVAEKCV